MLRLSKRLKGKRAFITGAASGLGRALALQLVRDGWKLWLTDQRADALEIAVKEANAAGGTAWGLTLDVTDRARYQDVVTQVLHQAGGAVDLLINNAGVAASGKIGQQPLADWDWLMGINLTGVVNGCHFFVDSFRQAGHGHIINIASAAALAPVPGMGAYCTSKAAVKMFSEVLHNELHGTGVRVSVVMPEFFQTNLADRTRGAEVELARILVEKAKHTAEDVAAHVLARAGAGQLHIVFPSMTAAAWVMLRLMPRRSLAVIRKMERMQREKLGKKQAQGAP